MSNYTEELVMALSSLADNENVQVTFKESAKGALVCAAAAMLGGVLMGPRGLAVGGTLGAIAAYGLTDGEFKSVGEIIANDLSQSEREELKDHVMNAINSVRPIDVAKVVGLIMSNNNIRNVVLNAIKSFATERLGLTIVA